MSNIVGRRVGALVLGYHQEEYIGYSVPELCQCLDFVVVMHSEQPWIRYNAEARTVYTYEDRTFAILQELRRRYLNLRVISGVWDDEEQMRNEGLVELLGCMVDICIVCDADEFYHRTTLHSLIRHAAEHFAPGRVFWGRYINFFRSFRYLVDGADLRLPTAICLDGHRTRFVNRRIPEGERVMLPDYLNYWHTGYVLSDVRMLEKVSTFGHAHEIVDRWYEEKWRSWTPETTDLDRVVASRWPRTREIDPFLAPDVLHAHAYFPNGCRSKPLPVEKLPSGSSDLEDTR